MTVHCFILDKCTEYGVSRRQKNSTRVVFSKSCIVRFFLTAFMEQKEGLRDGVRLNCGYIIGPAEVDVF